MPRGKMTGKLVSKSEVQRSVAKPPAKRGRPPKVRVNSTVTRKQSIANVTRTAQPVAKPAVKTHPHHPAISITVQIPSLRRTKAGATTTARPADHKSRKRLFVALGATVAVIVAGYGTFLLLPHSKHGPIAGNVVEAAARTAPDYQPLMLADQKPTTMSYDGKRNMVSYTTTFSEARITVSEQALPSNFSHDPAALMHAADSLDAKQRVDTSVGTVFVATNDVAGDQMGIFANSQVLVFIHVDHKMDDTFWKSFVEQMKPDDWQQAANQASS